MLTEEAELSDEFTNIFSARPKKLVLPEETELSVSDESSSKISWLQVDFVVYKFIMFVE